MGKDHDSFGPILLFVNERILLFIEFIEITFAVVIKEELLMRLNISFGE